MANKRNRNGKNTTRKDLITCVQLSKETRNRLAELGTKKDTFEDIILNLMDTPCGEEMGESQDDE